jgi:hypothetical protein
LLERIARLCSQFTLDDLAAAAARFGAADPLDRIIAGVRAGAEPAGLESDLDELDSAFARNGIDNITTGPRVYRELPGSSGHPVMRVWVCPAARPCSRVEVTTGAGCALLDKPLTCRDVQS